MAAPEIKFLSSEDVAKQRHEQFRRDCQHAGIEFIEYKHAASGVEYPAIRCRRLDDILDRATRASRISLFYEQENGNGDWIIHP